MPVIPTPRNPYTGTPYVPSASDLMIFSTINMAYPALREALKAYAAQSADRAGSGAAGAFREGAVQQPFTGNPFELMHGPKATPGLDVGQYLAPRVPAGAPPSAYQIPTSGGMGAPFGAESILPDLAQPTMAETLAFIQRLLQATP